MIRLQLKWVLAASFAMTTLYACDDSSSGGDEQPLDGAVAPDEGAAGQGGEGGVGGAGGAGGEGGQGGVGGEGGMGGEGGAGGVDPDMGVGGEGGEGGMGGEADMGMDAAPGPDMDVADMAPIDPLPPIIEPGGMCDPAAVEDECEGEFSTCLEGTCSLDVRPRYFRLVDAEVIEPQVAAAELQLALLLAAQQQALNVIFEGGGYGEDGRYLMYIGSGGYNRDNETYDYLYTFPIQNLFGHWRDPDNPTWYQDGPGEFILNVPSGFADVDGEQRRCYTRFAALTDEMAIQPTTDDDGNPLLMGRVQGALRRVDIEQTDFRTGDTVIELITYFEGAEPTIDTDGDGEADAYPFDFSVTAQEIVFTGGEPDGTNRDPNPPDINPPECAERD